MVLLQPSQTRIGTGEDIYLKTGAGGSAVISGGLTMNNSAINLGVAGVRSQLYFDSGVANQNTVLVYPDTRNLIIVEEPSGVASAINASGMVCPSFSSSVNTKVPVSIFDATPVVVAQLPFVGSSGDIAIFRVLLGYRFSTTGGATVLYAEFNGFWFGDNNMSTSPGTLSSNFPPDWTIQSAGGNGSPAQVTLTPGPVSGGASIVSSFIRFGANV